MSCKKYTKEPMGSSRLHVVFDNGFLPRNGIQWPVHRTQRIPKDMAPAAMEIIRMAEKLNTQTSFCERFLFPISPLIIQYIRIN